MNHLDDLQEEMMGYLMGHERAYGRNAEHVALRVDYGDLLEWGSMVIRARLGFGEVRGEGYDEGYQEGFADGYAYSPDLGHGKVTVEDSAEQNP